MKKLLLLLVVVVFIGGCERGGDAKKETPKAEKPTPEAASPVFTKEPGGFRDIEWGTDIAALADMVPAAGGEGLEGEAYFVRAHDELTLDGVRLKKIEYRFVQGKFSQAIATLAGDGGEALKLKGILFDAYGPVGPFMGKAPERSGIEVPFKEYRWQFKAGSIALLVNEHGVDNLLLFSGKADEPAAAGS